jgi:hypothetical protein
MVRALFDTNILVDYLNAVPEARAEFSAISEPHELGLSCGNRR